LSEDPQINRKNALCELKTAFGGLQFMAYSVRKGAVLRMIAAGGNPGGGKSGLHRVAQGVTPLCSNARNSGTERMSRAMSLTPGTGGSGEPLE